MAHPGNRRRERPVETFTTGLVFTIVFGTLLGAMHGAWWFVFPLAFAGIAPMVRGIVGMISARGRTIEGRSEAPLLDFGEAAGAKTSAEKEILAVARDSDGVVTPALVALKTSLSIDAADRVLQDLARRGHASMVVADDGRVEYQFQEFRSRLPPPRPAEP